MAWSSDTRRGDYVLVVICSTCKGMKWLSGHKDEADDYIGRRKRCECLPPPPPPEAFGPPSPGAIWAQPRKEALYDTEPIVTPFTFLVPLYGRVSFKAPSPSWTRKRQPW